MPRGSVTHSRFLGGEQVSSRRFASMGRGLRQDEEDDDHEMDPLSDDDERGDVGNASITSNQTNNKGAIGDKAKTLLAASGKLLLGRLKVASAGVKMFDPDMTDNLQMPKKSLGWLFLLGFIFYSAFVVVLAFSAANERSIMPARIAYLAVHEAMDSTNYKEIDRFSMLPLYLSSLAYSAISERTLNTPSNILVGGILVTQQKTKPSPCNTLPDTLEGRTPSTTDCLTDVDDESIDKSDIPAGNVIPKFRSLFEYEYLARETECFGAFCASPTQSMVRSSKVFYETIGQSLLLYNKTWWLNSNTPIVRTEDTKSNVPIDKSRFPMNDTQEGMLELFSDFVDYNTRVVFIEFAMLNSVEALMTTVHLMFEMPISGGVFPTLLVRSFNLVEPHLFQQLYLVIYAAFWMLTIVALFARRVWKGSGDCLVCKEKKERQILIFNCVKCHCPTELTTEVVACTQCKTPIPAIEHKCWRGVALDVWNWQLMIMMMLLVMAKWIMFMGHPVLLQKISNVFTTMSTGAIPFSQTFESAITLYRWYEDLIAVCVVMSYIKIFRYLSRGRINSRFVRTFQYALPPLMAFTINFIITFMGFVLAFHLIQGSQVQTFATLGYSSVSSFRALLGVLDWPELGTMGILFLLSFVIFFLICGSMMFNVFPSVLSVAYKRAIAVPHYDVEVLSLWLIIKPWLRKFSIIEDPEKKRQKLREAQLAAKAANIDLDGKRQNSSGAGDLLSDRGSVNSSGLEKPLMDPEPEEGTSATAGGSATTNRKRSMSFANKTKAGDNGEQVLQEDNDSEAESDDTAPAEMTVEEMKELNELAALTKNSTEEGRLKADKELQTKRVEKLSERTRLMKNAFEAMFFGLDDQVQQLSEQVAYLSEVLPSLVLDATNPHAPKRPDRGTDKGTKLKEVKDALNSISESLHHDHQPADHQHDHRHLTPAEVAAEEKKLAKELKKESDEIRYKLAHPPGTEGDEDLLSIPKANVKSAAEKKSSSGSSSPAAANEGSTTARPKSALAGAGDPHHLLGPGIPSGGSDGGNNNGSKSEVRIDPPKSRSRKDQVPEGQRYDDAPPLLLGSTGKDGGAIGGLTTNNKGETLHPLLGEGGSPKSSKNNKKSDTSGKNNSATKTGSANSAVPTTAGGASPLPPSSPLVDNRHELL